MLIEAPIGRADCIFNKWIDLVRSNVKLRKVRCVAGFSHCQGPGAARAMTSVLTEFLGSGPPSFFPGNRIKNNGEYEQTV